jgi:hypothetical protein
MKFSHPLIIVTASLLASCLTSDRAAADGARQLIEAYMHGIPEDYVIYDESGEVITREQMRANALRDWSVISRTLDLTITVDSLLLPTDSTAVVYTSQRWERMMSRPDSSGEDTVLTTQRHRETWRRTPVGWRNYDIDELGGAIFINGAPYSPKRDAR